MGEALLVAEQRAARLLAQLELLARVAEATAAPGDVEQGDDEVGAAGRGGAGSAAGVLMEALEHLVDDDAEALVERRLARNPQAPGRTCSAAGRAR